MELVAHAQLKQAELWQAGECRQKVSGHRRDRDRRVWQEEPQLLKLSRRVERRELRELDLKGVKQLQPAQAAEGCESYEAVRIEALPALADGQALQRAAPQLQQQLFDAQP